MSVLSKKRTQRNPNSLANLRLWKPGESGNPSGRPKRDQASEIAQAIFEKNPEKIYEAMGKALLSGNAQVFRELAIRAFGNVTERHEYEVTINFRELVEGMRKREDADSDDNASRESEIQD